MENYRNFYNVYNKAGYEQRIRAFEGENNQMMSQRNFREINGSRLSLNIVINLIMLIILGCFKYCSQKIDWETK